MVLDGLSHSQGLAARLWPLPGAAAARRLRGRSRRAGPRTSRHGAHVRRSSFLARLVGDAGRRPRLAAPGRMTGVHEHRDGRCVDLLAETDLAAAERRLRQAAAKGGLLDLASATGRRGPSGARSWLGTRAAELIEVSPAGQQLVEHLRADSFDTPAGG